MKLKNILIPILSSSPVTTSACVVTTSCSNNDIEQFVSDRTFSLMSFGVYGQSEADAVGAYFTYGTGWIIDDSTPSNHNDYKYYVATNWHVTHGFDLIPTYDAPSGKPYIGQIYCYADKSSANILDKVIPINNYTWLKNGAFTKMSPDNFVYTDQTIPGRTKCIDMYVCEIDFGDCANNFLLSTKQKLDHLNKYRSDNGYINKFVNADDENIINKKKYVAGYPAKDALDGSMGGRWEIQSLRANELKYLPKETEDEDHPISEDPNIDNFFYYDVSPQYACQTNKGDSWMTGGASGSMLITEDKEICGIYWGGLGLNVKDKMVGFYPRFSLFKTNNKDFISKWTK